MWITPKTDWNAAEDNGVYIGDRFNAVDYNRIKNNLKHLRDLAVTMFKEFAIANAGADKLVGDYFYADEINRLEENLAAINSNTLKQDYGSAPLYMDNGNTMDYVELNRLEGAMLDLYLKMTNQSDGRRKFVWNFGRREEI